MKDVRREFARTVSLQKKVEETYDQILRSESQSYFNFLLILVQLTRHYLKVNQNKAELFEDSFFWGEGSLLPPIYISGRTNPMLIILNAVVK